MIVSIEAPWLATQVEAALLVDPPEALILSKVKVSFSQLAIVPLETATAGSIFLVTKSFSLWSSMSLVLAMYSFKSHSGHRHLSSVHLIVIVGPYGWFGLVLLAPNTSWKVPGSSVIWIALGVILNKLRSDGLLTLAEAKIITVFKVR